MRLGLQVVLLEKNHTQIFYSFYITIALLSYPDAKTNRSNMDKNSFSQNTIKLISIKAKFFNINKNHLRRCIAYLTWLHWHRGSDSGGGRHGAGRGSG